MPTKHIQSIYSKTCLKRPLKNRQNKDLNDNLHSAIIGLENQFLIFLKVAVLARFYYM